MVKSVALIVASALAASSALGAGGAPGRAVPTREQLETDWRRQLALRYEPPHLDGKRVPPASDAAGAVDGVKNGKWGFHTEHEKEPWWQVDLGEAVSLERIVVYNRCDNGMGTRNSRIRVLLSADGESFSRVYEHDGTPFLGQPDQKPLVVRPTGAEARVVRLQLPGTSYFHLDEVEVYAAGNSANIALRKPVNQSSVSQWSVNHGKPLPPPARAALEKVIASGLQLAVDLAERGVETGAIRERLRTLAPDAPGDDSVEARYFAAREVVRELALANPVLSGFDDILFVKRAPGMFPHVCDQYYGWWSRAGGGVYVLKDFRTPDARLACLTGDWAPGSFLRPDLSYDGKRVLFAYCRTYPEVAACKDKTAKNDLPEDSFYHVFEMNLDGSGVKQLTRGRYDDFDARYLPDGRIVFLSTRKGTALQSLRASARASLAETCPDSYVRCGGGNWRPVPVFTLHTIEADCRDMRPISAFENFEWTPAVAADGTVLYARWDYIDRFNGHFMSLWSTNPDGTGARLVYGNYTTRPQCVFEARPVPGSNKLIFTATAHHSITGGSLVLFDRRLGIEHETPLVRLTPDVPFPETEGRALAYYAHPWPLSEEYYLACWSDRPLPAHRAFNPDDPANPRNALGLYLYDRYGNLTLLHRDSEISCASPIPVRARRRPPVIPDRVTEASPRDGRFIVQDVTRGLEALPAGTVRRLRVVAVPPKVQPQKNLPCLGVSKEDPGKYVLGTVPVEPDGSASFVVPSGVPVFFQALDESGLAVQTMRTLVYVQPGESSSCIGCHEQRDLAPPGVARPAAALRGASRLTPGPEGTWPLRYDTLVQTVLDRHCTRCHAVGSKNAKAAKINLAEATSYDVLTEAFDGDLRKLAFERDRSDPGQTPARNSKLFRMLTDGEGHHGVKLAGADRYRLAVWMDTYAQRAGSYSAEQEQELTRFRVESQALLQVSAGSVQP